MPPFLGNLTSDKDTDGYGSASSYGSGESYGEKSRSDGEFKFACINNNNNTVVVGEEPPTPIPPVEECAAVEDIEDCFANTEFMGGVQFTAFVAALESGITIEINGQDITLRSFNDICLAFEGLTTYQQLVDAVSEIEIDTGAEFGEGFFAVVNCIAEAIGIAVPDMVQMYPPISKK